MKKSASAVILVFIVATIFTGCATRYYGVAVSNVPNISRLYIRNAGATHWGANMAGTRQDIDISRFSERVDIRVVDTSGAVFSRYNVPFNSASFVETNRTSEVNQFAFGVVLLAVGIPLLMILGGGE